MSNEVKRGRGRPKSETAIRLERVLREKGTVGVRFGDSDNLPSETTARMRLYNAARAIGVNVRTYRAGSGATTRLVAETITEAPDVEIVDDDAPEMEPQEAE